MAVEIGSLVVRGTFGQPSEAKGANAQALEEQLMILRRSMLEEMRDMLDEANRRARDR